MKIIGFDYGTKYIGVAIGQNTTNTAKPLDCLVIKNNKINWIELEKLIQYWKPNHLLVGIPVTMDNKLQQITMECLNFSEQLKLKFNLPVLKVDERLSTWEAKRNLNLNYHKNLNNKEIKKINSYAAVVITEQWLNQQI